jgi:hypothetical protein
MKYRFANVWQLWPLFAEHWQNRLFFRNNGIQYEFYEHNHGI